MRPKSKVKIGLQKSHYVRFKLIRLSMKKVTVNSSGIKNRLKQFKSHHAIAEYIWNGFDAGANEINIKYKSSDLGTITELLISDNGSGIPHEELEKKFTPVLSSEKYDKKLQHSLIHGKNGLGRFTFYHFCNTAVWATYFMKNGSKYNYEITIHANTMHQYDSSNEAVLVEPIVSDMQRLGTTVSFTDFSSNLSDFEFKEIILPYLAKEFAWFIELNKNYGFVIKINEIPLDYEHLIKDRVQVCTWVETVTKTKEVPDNKVIFDVEYLRWSHKLNKNFSCLYCTDGSGILKYSSPTTLNNQADNFFHSVIVSSKYFDDFIVDTSKGANGTNLLNNHTDKSDDFKNFLKWLTGFLKNKRKPFIVDYAKQLIEEYEKDGVFPKYNSKNQWEIMRSKELKETVKQLYEVEPRIFSNLNIAQKKTFVGFIALLLENGETEEIFKILEDVVELSVVERACFANQLKTTKLSCIIKTIELIVDRYKSVEEFKKLVLDPTMYADEVPHLQKMMEKNYWLLGEEYQLVTAAEPDFEEALRRYTHLLHGDKSKKTINHEDKNKEMDIFLVRQNKRKGIIENIVLELKHPINISLGKREIDQVYDYYNVIKSESRFNAANMEWKFFLIGNKFDTSGYIADQLKSLENHNDLGLVHAGSGYKVYAFKWSEIFIEFELRHDFLNKKLQLERDRLALNQHDSADDIVENTRTSDAPSELVVESSDEMSLT